MILLLYLSVMVVIGVEVVIKLGVFCVLFITEVTEERLAHFGNRFSHLAILLSLSLWVRCMRVCVRCV